MEYARRLRIRAVGMCGGSIRAFLFGGLIAVITTGAAGQTTTRPPVGGVGSPPDAMIFYVAQGAAGACGPGCSDWIAAEGTVQFDTNRRVIAILDPGGSAREGASSSRVWAVWWRLGRLSWVLRSQHRL